MFNVLITYQDIQNINWEALITSIIGTLTIQGVVMFALTTVLKKIGLKSDATEKYASQIGKSVEDFATRQKSANETLKDVRDVTIEMVKTDEQMQKVYKQASEIVKRKVELIIDLRNTVDEYLKEE